MKHNILGLGVVIFTTILGILIAFNFPIYYTHSEIIYYPNEDKTYLEEYHVKQSIGKYLISDGLIEDKDLIELRKTEIKKEVE